MSEEQETDTPVNTASLKRVTHEVPELGPVRAREGTATEYLAGAAEFWHKEAVRLEGVMTAWDHDKRKSWRDGFLTGVVSLSVLAGVIAGYVAFWH